MKITLNCRAQLYPSSESDSKQQDSKHGLNPISLAGSHQIHVKNSIVRPHEQIPNVSLSLSLSLTKGITKMSAKWPHHLYLQIDWTDYQKKLSLTKLT